MARNSESIMRDLLASAGVGTEGAQPWDLKVHDSRAYARMLHEGVMGFGESYMDGWWDCDRLDECFYKLIIADLEKQVGNDWKTVLHVAVAKLWNLQSRRRAFEIGEKHYDVGNDLYRAMLDERMAYTCGYWKHADTLAAAQEAKLELVCKKIGLEPGMTVLELGCGWGSFAKYAAENYGVEVVGLTVSKEQVALGTDLCKGLPVTIKLQDYREVTGQFDAVISIGLLEHVGYKNYRTYMETVDRCLKDDGIAFIHVIGSNNRVTIGNSWFHKYIFPNAMNPSIGQLGDAMDHLFVMEDLHNIGPDYDPTVMAWFRNFDQAWPDLKHAYDERFYRMWKFYLLSGAASSRSRRTQLWQIVMTKRGRAQPDCRFS